MNQPGQAEGNWHWRCTEAMLTPAVWQWLHDLTLTANRVPAIALERIEGGHQSTGIALGRAV